MRSLIDMMLDQMINDHPSPPPNFLPNTINCSLSQNDSTPAPATPLKMFAPAPLKNDFTPSLARIFLAQSMDPLNFSASPEVIIILLLMVSMGQEASPEPTVTPQPKRKFTKRLSLRSPGSIGLTESQIPKQRPLQMMIPTHEITNPLQRPATPSVLIVCLQTSMRPEYCFCPPFLADLRSLVSLVLAQSREQTKRSETEPAAPPEARFPRNQMKYPSLFLSLPKSLLKQSLREKLRAWVGKYLMTLVPFPFQRAFTPSSETIRLAQSPIPAQGLSSAPLLSMASASWILILMTSIGDAKVLETAAETPPIRKSRANLPMSFFLAGLSAPFSAILLKQNYIKVEHNYINQICCFIWGGHFEWQHQSNKGRMGGSREQEYAMDWVFCTRDGHEASVGKEGTEEIFADGRRMVTPQGRPNCPCGPLSLDTAFQLLLIAYFSYQTFIAHPLGHQQGLAHC